MPIVAASRFLLRVILEIKGRTARYGTESRIPDDGFDHDLNGFEFSVYSPPEVPRQLHITWDILGHVIDGVSTVVVGSGASREITFVVKTGPDNIFRGYGHFVALRPRVNG